jgi:YD repeat-containing protein
VLDLVYDVAGRLDALAVPGRGTIDWSYSALTGQLESITTPEGSPNALSFGYDGFLAETETWSGEVTGSVTQSHDDELLVASETVSVGATNDAVSFLYDADDLLTAAGALSLTPDPDHGLLVATSLGAITTGQDYSDFGELSLLSASGPGGLLYQESITARDGLGRITHRDETIGGVTTSYDYTYDAAGRLDQVYVGGLLTHDYGFDTNGNPAAGSVDDQDRLLALGGFTYTYTDNGELLTKTETATSAVTTYAYDALGNLLQVVLPGAPATTISDVVDGRNRRIGKKRNGTCTGTNRTRWRSWTVPATW